MPKTARTDLWSMWGALRRDSGEVRELATCTRALQDQEGHKVTDIFFVAHSREFNVNLFWQLSVN